MQWRHECRRSIPCWLMSMALHLLLVIVLGSIIVPSSSQRYLSTILLATFDEERNSPPGAEVSLAASESADTDADLASGFIQVGDPTPSRRPENAGNVQAEETATSQGPTPAPRADGELRVPSSQFAAAILPRSAGAAPREARIINASAVRTAITEDQLGASKKTSPALQLDLEQQRLFDDVVDRFIEFDIGQLQGAEGERARHDFEQLGPAAIPALVRGLNKSATIHASCPVVVISNKLGEVMDDNREPAMLRYVADHLADGVPRGAPHIARIQALKRQLLREDRKPRGMQVASTEHDAASLIRTLSNPDDTARLEAAERAAQQSEEVPPDDRADLAWALIRRLSDRNLRVRAAARAALTALAGGQDFGPLQQPARAKYVAIAASRWYAHFDQERYEAMAAGVLASARHFEDARRKTAAMRYYRKLIEEYDGTAAANEASERLKALAKFQLR